jgi:hypothetical protein
MTRWGVGRTQRTAIPTAPGVPTGASALMPPHSQGAERRTERPASRTSTRWGLRTLVIGGLAGAAWLLTGAAAHAADRDPAPEGSLLGGSLIGSVVDGDTAQPAVNRILYAAARSPESDWTADQHHTASVLTGPVRVYALPVRTLTSTLGVPTRQHHDTDANPALGGADRVVRELTGPLRLTGGPADSSLIPVGAPLTNHLRPVTDLLPPEALAPQATLPDATLADVTLPDASLADPTLPHAARPAMTTQGPISDTAVAVPRTTTVGSATEILPTRIVTVAGHRAAHRYSTGNGVSRRHSVAEATAADHPETGQEVPPGGDGPAPLQVHLGAVSGISTNGSGTPTEGGSAAFLPAAVAAGTMAFHRLPIATDVEVRRHDAEAPTVSPD